MTDSIPRVADASALVGGIIWIGVVAVDALGAIQEILALAFLVLVPLGLRLADTPRRDGTRTRWYVAAVVCQPVAAIPAVASLSVRQGVTATAMAVPWFALTALVAGFGCWRLLQRGPWPLAELTIDAGLVYLAVGGGALLLDRFGIALIFEPIIVLLTAVHFHYAGFALPVVAGLAGRVPSSPRFQRIRQVTTGIIAVGPAIIGTGITAAALALPLAGIVEFTAVVFFTSAIAVFSLAVVVGVLPRLESRLQGALIGVAFLTVTASMGFAVLYGLARWTGGTYLGIHVDAFTLMVRYHGQLNAFGFALLALVGWRLAPPNSTACAPGIPFSRLAGGRNIGLDFLERSGYATHDDEDEGVVSGMMRSVDDYAWDGFDPGAVSPAVRRFYEHSGEYLLAVEPDWGRPWGTLAPVYRLVATRMDQLSLPVAPVTGETALRGSVVRVDGPDEHAGTRAWVRSNDHATTPEDRMTYVATYGRYVSDGTAYLRATFPLPGANLTGILRVENTGNDGEGLTLSSYSIEGNADDAGLYLAVRGFGIRLPLDETLTITPSDGSSDGVDAVHEIRLLGHRVVTLEYDIEPARNVETAETVDPVETVDPAETAEYADEHSG